MTRVLVCGGRDFHGDLAEKYIEHFLTCVHEMRPFKALIHGAAKGADTLASEWALRHGVNAESYPADWETHGVSAGPIRNLKMLEEGKPELVIAFPGGKGTAHMKRIARAHGVQVIETPKLPTQKG